MQNRYALLLSWLRSHFKDQDFEITALPGDASFRRYFRVRQGDDSYIAMDAPPDVEPCASFVAVAETLRQAGVMVPAIFAQDISRGFLLLADFGDQLYSKVLQADNAGLLYQTAWDTLLRIQECQSLTDNQPFKAFDKAFMGQELANFQHWFLERWLNVQWSEQLLNKSFEFLLQAAAEQPQVCIHRDYHSRNLLWLESGNVGVLDFQDAMWGPVTYDLVSLLRDCYIAWPHAQVDSWVSQFYDTWKQHQPNTVSREQFSRWFDLMGIQRHLKALFIFARKYLRDGVPTYLADIPRTLNYVLEVSARYPELRELNQRLAAEELPRVKALLQEIG